MLADGRVLYTSWAHDGPGPASGDGGGGKAGAGGGGGSSGGGGRFFLLAANWEGGGQNEVHGAHGGPRLRAMPVEMPDRTVLFVESDGEQADGSGRLVEISWQRPLHPPRVLSSDAARYRDPRPLPDGRTLVARAEGAASHALVLFDRQARRPAGGGYDDPAWHDVDAVAVAPHAEPMGRIPAIWPGKYTTGDIHCMNVYHSDRPELADVAPGSIHAVRVVEALPRPLPAAGEPLPPYDPAAPFGATAALRTRILGEVPVMPDGSFHLTVPADTAFTLQTLDADGVAVRTMRSWLWSKPWFMRTCIGCHESGELAPQNRVTQAMESTLRPVLGEATTRRTPGCVHDVAPVLRDRCGGACHGPEVAMVEERTVLDRWSMPPFDRAYRTLVPRYVRPGVARESQLIRMVRGDGGMPRHGALLADELRTLAAWIDLGAQWDATRYDLPVPRAEAAAGPGGAGSSGGWRSAAPAAPAAAAPAAAGPRAGAGGSQGRAPAAPAP